MQKSRTAMIIMLSAMILLSISACEKKSTADSSDTRTQAEESVLHTESESSEDSNPAETSATIPSSPTPTADPVSPFENFLGRKISVRLLFFRDIGQLPATMIHSDVG